MKRIRISGTDHFKNDVECFNCGTAIENGEPMTPIYYLGGYDGDDTFCVNCANDYFENAEASAAEMEVY